MSTRVQVILNDEEAARFRKQAQKESVSLSAWLREAGRIKLRSSKPTRSLKDHASLLSFFNQCDLIDQEGVKELDWAEHKKMIAGGYKRGQM